MLPLAPLLGAIAKPLLFNAAADLVKDHVLKGKDEGAQKPEDQPKSPQTNADF
jgi:hypothetical protein